MYESGAGTGGGGGGVLFDVDDTFGLGEAEGGKERGTFNSAAHESEYTM